MPETLSWCLAGVFAFLGGWCVLANYVIVAAWVFRRQHSSVVPLLGGLFLAGALLLCPVAAMKRLAWLPFVLDLGCLFMLVNCVYFFVIRRGHER